MRFDGVEENIEVNVNLNHISPPGIGLNIKAFSFFDIFNENFHEYTYNKYKKVFMVDFLVFDIFGYF